MTEQALPRPTATAALAAVRADYRLAGIFLMAIGPGLSITVSGGTISFWLAENGFKPSEIGFLALAMLPFVLKFIWAPLLEGAFKPLESILGFRKSWLIPINILTALSILVLSQVDPSRGNLAMIAAAAFLFSLCASSQEIVSEALRIDRTAGPRLAIGTTLTGIGARIGMLIGSAGPLLIAARAGWPAALMFVALLMLLVSVGALILGDVRSGEGKAQSLNLRARLVEPFAEFFSREGAWLVFAFMLFARLSDMMAGAMFPPFAVAAGYSKDQLAFVNSVVGFAAIALGSLAGLLLYRRVSERAGLLVALIFAAATNVGFVILTHTPGDVTMLAAVMGFENFAGGIGAVILLSYMSRLCDARFTATQFALLVAVGSVIRFVSPGPSGKLVEALGYQNFFIVTIFAVLPVLIILTVMVRRGLVSANKPLPGRPHSAAFE
jgi:MFS transporter, PAT family, beta-lactamase induction signal transducer AmpG